MATETELLDAARGRVLDRMAAGRRLVRLAIGGAALLEAAMLALCALLVDWHDRSQILFFLMFILGYFILVLGLIALAGHVTAATARILAAMNADAPS